MRLLTLTLAMILASSPALAYLDPGTGSYLLQILLSTLFGAAFAVKIYWKKIKGFFGGNLSRKQE